MTHGFGGALGAQGSEVTRVEGLGVLLLMGGEGAIYTKEVQGRNRREQGRLEQVGAEQNGRIRFGGNLQGPTTRSYHCTRQKESCRGKTQVRIPL